MEFFSCSFLGEKKAQAKHELNKFIPIFVYEPLNNLHDASMYGKDFG